jgi:hypothetical protein
MKLLVLYRPNSEHGRLVDEFIHEYEHRHDGGRLEILNIDSRDGSATAALYDIVEYPALLALRDDGSVANSWTGGELPLISDVLGYTRTF